MTPGITKRPTISKTLRWPVIVLSMMFIIAILAPILSNNKPLFAKYNGYNMFPALSFQGYCTIYNTDSRRQIEQLDYDKTDWLHLDLDAVLWPLNCYSPGKTDMLNSNYVSPFAVQRFYDKKGAIISIPTRYRHWLGTTNRGEDVLAGILYGTRISLTVGIVSMLIAGILGITLGALAGYFGNTELRTPLGTISSIILGTAFAFFYSIYLYRYDYIDALSNGTMAFLYRLFISLVISSCILFFFWIFGKLMCRWRFFRRSIAIPLDTIISTIIGTFISIPKLIIIITVASFVRPSIITVIVIIGLINWTHIARLTRSEVLKIKNFPYVESSRVLGYSGLRIILRHIMPNALSPILVALSLSVASAILAEAALSFLGVGVPVDIVTWGSLISQGKDHFNAWWLVAFPGVCIFATVYSFNAIARYFNDK